MFIDEAVIHIKAGNGGNGCFSHHRTKTQPKGKADGGNGGRGGNIYIQASSNIHTLLDQSYHHFYKAERGQHGKGSNKYGKKGKSAIIIVPLGTLIFDKNSGELLFDCLDEKKKFIVAKGGRGGRGNAAMVCRKNPNPECAEFGKEGEERDIKLVLKVLADVGLVGRPNAGKSTFLSSISKAHPKIADYPFTTTHPHLGIVKLHSEFKSFTVADIPGLIKGSNEGKGLGIRFLKHIERTRILAIMVESNVEDPKAEADILINELNQYSPILANKPKCFILTKTDIYPDNSFPKIEGWHAISSITKSGVEKLLYKLKELLDKHVEIEVD